MTSSIAPPSTKPNPQAWYRPTFSHEHGVYIVLLVSFLTGAAAAQSWTIDTTLALLCAFCGFQAEHPVVQQIKQRRSWKPRFLFWGGLYGGIAGAIALYLWLHSGTHLLLGIYLGAIAAFVFDGVSVLHREQKSITNELLTFAAVCLCAPFAYVVTTGTISFGAIALWLLNTLFFSSTIFSVKFRKSKTPSVVPMVVFQAIALLMVAGLWWFGGLSAVTAGAIGVSLLKFLLIVARQEWYRTAPIQRIAMLETGTAVLFLAIVAVSLLPPTLA